MLTELAIKDFGIAESLRLEFSAGMLCITGETGSGKSIIVNALAFVLGERGQSEWVRTGAEKCEVTAVFSDSGGVVSATLATELGLDPSEPLVLRRELAKDGRSRVWLNDRPGTVSALKRLSSGLCDLHGQHSHQWLLNPDSHVTFLDAFLNRDVLNLYTNAFNEWERCSLALAATESEISESGRQKEFWEFQLKELDRVDPQPNEYDELSAQRDRIRSFAELGDLFRLLDAELSSADDSLIPRLGDLEQRVLKALKRAPHLEPWVAGLANARTHLEELATMVSREMTGSEPESQSLDSIEARLHQLYTLKQKFGGSLEAAAQERDALRSKLEQAQDSAHILDTLREARQIADGVLIKEAKKLASAREQAAIRLVDALKAPLSELGLGSSPLSVMRNDLPRESWHAGGTEHIEFLLSANPNEDPKPLTKIASGGELSRVMLALKSVLPGGDRVKTLIFDEVDTGIDAQTASRVAERLASLAVGRQVVVITHLHPIAARADHHWLVKKERVGGRHVPRVLVLDSAQRLAVLGGLIAGGDVTKESLEAARALVASRRRD